MEVHRGEVFYADLSPVVGSEQGGVRPVLHKYDSIKSHDKVSLCVIEKEDIIKEELTLLYNVLFFNYA